MPATQANVEFWFRLLYGCIRGSCYGSVDESQFSAWLAHLWLLIIIIGYALAIAAFIAIVYVLVRLFELRKKEKESRAVSISNPERVFVVSPVMLKGAEDNLSEVFPKRISEKFEYIHFATDTGKEGNNVVPGIGGSVYELLGLGNRSTKNKYTPQIVKDRRRKLFRVTASATVNSGPMMSEHLGVGTSRVAGSRTSPARNTKVKR